jgi:hypothetical protein
VPYAHSEKVWLKHRFIVFHGFDIATRDVSPLRLSILPTNAGNHELLALLLNKMRRGDGDFGDRVEYMPCNKANEAIFMSVCGVGLTNRSLDVVVRRS